MVGYLKKKMQKGMTLLESVFVLGILGVLGVIFFGFQTDLIRLNKLIEGGTLREAQLQRVLHQFTAQARSAGQSNAGGYLVEEATPSSFVFFVDSNADGLVERTRYFIDNGTVKRGVVIPVGPPYTYNLADETVVELVTDVTVATIFTYYDNTYTGTGPSLPTPIDISRVRLIRMNLVSDPNGAQPPSPVDFEVQVKLRNIQ